MGASITLAGENLIAQKQAAQQILDVQRFIFANVPGLNASGPVDRAAGKPAAAQIVYSAEIPNDNAGYVNPSQVVYSLQVGSDVGDWDFNWIGLESAEGVLFAVAYVPLQQKRRNIPPLQIGNNLTRNFLVVFDGAQALTGITIDASTWQHDFTVRLAGIDERERQSNRDIYGRACFFGSALQLEKVGAVYQLKPGTAYVEGVRLQRSAALPVVPSAFPTTAWLDVALQRELNDVVASWRVVWGAGKVDYVDSAGVQHYCVAIADLPNSNTITDSRPVENIAGALVKHFQPKDQTLTALAALITEPNNLIYSTGSDQFAISPLTAKARLLLESADESAMRTFLGLVKQTSLVDTTAGALMLAGAFGLGNASSADFIGDLNTLTASGFYSYSTAGGTTNTPSSIGTLLHLNRNPTSGTFRSYQIAFADEKVFRRSNNAGTWSAWCELWHNDNLIPTDLSPPGAIVHFARNSAPSGWLKANGAEVNRTTYAALFAAIGTTFGAGNGSTTFNLPDLRGEFLRSWDDGRGVDSGRAFGSAQADELKSHSHKFSVYSADPTGANAADSDGTGQVKTASTAATGGSETRPRNIALLACIKY